MAATEQSRTDKFNKWVQTSAIIVAAIWGIYTFIYTQVLVPKSAPVNISVGLELKRPAAAPHASQGGGQPLIPVEIDFSAKNPSPRQVYLLPSFWVAYGVKISAAGEQDPFQSDLVIKGDTGTLSVQRHATEDDGVVVAYGRLLMDTVLKPSETSARRMIFYVPQNQYDLLRVTTVIPTVDKPGIVDMEYQLNEKTGIQPTVYRLGPKGARTEIKPDKDGSYPSMNAELQQAMSDAELSLW